MEDEAMLISKIKNICIMLLSAISSDRIERVDHYLDDRLSNHYRELINNNKKRNVRQKFDQLNIGNVQILENNDNLLIAVIDLKYIDYIIDRSTGQVVSGNDKNRVTFKMKLTFNKKNVENRMIYRCPNCGAALNINLTSFCDHCGQSLDERYSPIVLSDVEYI